MSVIMADPRRKPLDPSKSISNAELANALNTFFGYAGTYSFAGGQLSVHIEVRSDFCEHEPSALGDSSG
jgi:hypothetical protein